MALALACSVGVGAAAANAAVIYLEDFESGPLGAEWTGLGAIETTGGLSAFGFGDLHLRNAGTSATVLTLSGLAAHTQVTLEFDLALWDSIDFGDVFQVVADGTFLFNSGDFGNYFAPAPSDLSHGPGVHITDPFTGFAVPEYGVNPGFRDAGQSVSFTFAHSAASLVLQWIYPGAQAGSDESFGIDNLSVSTNAVVDPDPDPDPTPVPEPATMLLLGAGLAAAAISRRRL